MPASRTGEILDVYMLRRELLFQSRCKSVGSDAGAVLRLGGFSIGPCAHFELICRSLSSLESRYARGLYIGMGYYYLINRKINDDAALTSHYCSIGS